MLVIGLFCVCLDPNMSDRMLKKRPLWNSDMSKCINNNYSALCQRNNAADQPSGVSITQMTRKRKLGRKRKYRRTVNRRVIGSRNRMRAHRAKQVPQSASQLAWSRYLSAIGLGMDRGEVMTDAPSSTLGRLETGGMDFNYIASRDDRS
jgi:hypothetical protein